MSATRLEQKQALIEALARFLVEDQSLKSIESASVRSSFSRGWLQLRGASTLKGYPTHEEAVATLTEILK